MSTFYYIAGRRFRRHSVLKLTPDERATLASDGVAVAARPVEWPLVDQPAYMDRAYVDAGGTDIWGAGPYLKVPNFHPVDEVEVVNRVFCPWGYPPDPVRDFRRPGMLRLERVELTRVEPSRWEWRLTVRRDNHPL